MPEDRLANQKGPRAVAGDLNNFRPNLKKQMTYAGVLLAAIISAYLLTTLFVERPKPEPEPKNMVSSEQEQTVTPWYQKQSPPPAMITTPDLPLFPDDEDGKAEPRETARAYEEALPKETYIPKAASPAEALSAPVQVPETAPQPVQPLPSQPKVAAVVTQRPETPLDATLPRWRKFAVAAPISIGEPRIAIIIDDMGVDKKRSAQAIELQAPLTLSFLTYATELEYQTEKARSRGHELMLHVSMEPGSKAVDPGPNALLTGLSNEELRRRLEWGFQRFSTYVGINNHMGSKFTSDAKAMGIVIEEVKSRGLLFLDSRTSGNTVGAKLARQMGVPVAERNIFLDHENTIEAVNAQLRQVEILARQTGSVIAIGHPRDATIKALKIWLAGVEGKGFKLVPLTALVSNPNPP